MFLYSSSLIYMSIPVSEIKGIEDYVMHLIVIDIIALYYFFPKKSPKFASEK